MCATTMQVICKTDLPPQENTMLEAHLECKRGDTVASFSLARPQEQMWAPPQAAPEPPLPTSTSHQGLGHQLPLSGTFLLIPVLSCPWSIHPLSGWEVSGEPSRPSPARHSTALPHLPAPLESKPHELLWWARLGVWPWPGAPVPSPAQVCRETFPLWWTPSTLLCCGGSPPPTSHAPDALLLGNTSWKTTGAAPPQLHCEQPLPCARPHHRSPPQYLSRLLATSGHLGNLPLWSVSAARMGAPGLSLVPCDGPCRAGSPSPSNRPAEGQVGEWTTTRVTQLRVFVVVLDVNDNAPEFPFTTKEQDVQEDTKVNSTVIPEAELQATDRDKDSTLFYTLQEVSPGAGSFFSLLGVNRPALRLDRALDFYKWQNMTFRLLVRVSGSPSCVLDAQAGPVGGPLPDTAELLQDTREEHREPSHTATATLVLKVLPADLRPPWFLPCSYSDGAVCIQAQYQGAIPTGHTLVMGAPQAGMGLSAEWGLGGSGREQAGAWALKGRWADFSHHLGIAVNEPLLPNHPPSLGQRGQPCPVRSARGGAEGPGGPPEGQLSKAPPQGQA
ncbi:Hypothetical predicted protein [Marmota monax]|uniref:Cadherin domain-containing protein n=1 Tax=Marmota monax TaxID=9995 RepID=A0A5E4AWK6_MARMO|nr:Hypothetical predicted protein [Marmota monax]